MRDTFTLTGLEINKISVDLAHSLSTKQGIMEIQLQCDILYIVKDLHYSTSVLSVRYLLLSH